MKTGNIMNTMHKANSQNDSISRVTSKEGYKKKYREQMQQKGSIY